MTRHVGKKKRQFNTTSSKMMFIALAIEIALILVIHLWNLGKIYGFYISMDETGYWSNAALLAGEDWGNVWNTTNFYSAGYSFILVPIMLLKLPGLMTYRIACALNAIFMVVSFITCYCLLKKIFKGKSELGLSIVSLVVCLYPSFIAHSSVAYTEVYILMLTWLLVYQAYILTEKITIPRMIVFALELGYIYIVHQRCLGIVIGGALYAIAITIFNEVKKNRFKAFLLFAVVFAGVFVAGIFLKKYLQSVIYLPDSSGTINNDYGHMIATIENTGLVKSMLLEAAGQVWYLCFASFGMVMLGLVWIVKKIFKNKNHKQQAFYCMLICILILSLGISCFTMRRTFDRLDKLIYGRYVENVLVLFIPFGMLYIKDFIKKKRSLIGLVIYALFMALLSFVISKKFAIYNISLDTMFHAIYAPAVYKLYKIFGFSIYKWTAIHLGAVAIICILSRFIKQSNYIVSALLIAFGIWNGFSIITQRIYTHEKAHMKELSEKKEVLETLGEDDTIVYYLKENGTSYRGIWQLYMRDKTMIVIQSVEEIEGMAGQSNIYLIAGKSDEVDIESFILFDTVDDKQVYKYWANN